MLSALALCGAAALLGMTQGKEPKDIVAGKVTASEFIVTDSDGNKRLSLSYKKFASVAFWDEKGENCVAQLTRRSLSLNQGRSDVYLVARDDGSGLLMSDHSGKTKVSLQATDHPALTLWGSGNARAAIGIVPTQPPGENPVWSPVPTLLLSDKGGKVLHQVPR